jgi:DegV family protein with EDD domain
LSLILKEVNMNKVAVITDSIAAISPEMAQEYGIGIVPAHVIMDGKDYPDTEIDMGMLYARLEEKENLPTTSGATTGQFLQAYQEMSQRAEAILVITLTSAYSTTYGAAVQAREMAREKLLNTIIEVVDCRTVAAAQLLIVLQAARAATRGKSLQEVTKLANDMIPRVNDLSMRDTLFYLDKGGLVFEAQSWAEAESKSTFRAILRVDASTEGITKPVARAKTKTQIMNKMVDIAKERVRGKKLYAAIVHTNVPDQAEQLKKMILSQFQCDELYVAEALGATAAKNGRGLIHFGFYGGD